MISQDRELAIILHSSGLPGSITEERNLIQLWGLKVAGDVQFDKDVRRTDVSPELVFFIDNEGPLRQLTSNQHQRLQ